MIEECQDILSVYLDSTSGNTTIRLDNEIFLDLARHYEREFHSDMSRLNILPPDALTRVSEYIPEIIKFIKKIIENGYAYESNSSVYFDTLKFNQKHSYAKLEPERMGDIAALNEGERALIVKSGIGKEKKNECDFVLWKKSKPGEPVWQSPWGLGRPGWHIECSVMASTVLGQQFDIHAGGIDLKFLHHDNEIAQSEAHYDNDSWANYFLHSGHLTISGCKMSKSLKNFITIQQALEKYSARQLRLLFLLHSWSSTLDYSERSMEQVISYERFANEFFLNVKTHIRTLKEENDSIKVLTKFNESDLALQERFSSTKHDIYRTLCDSIDTPAAMECLRQLISTTNIYMNSVNTIVNRSLLRNIALYVTRMLTIFGLNLSSGFDSEIGLNSITNEQSLKTNLEDITMPYIKEFALFRDAVRQQAIALKNHQLLKLCDQIRDETMPKLGVRLEDRRKISVVFLSFYTKCLLFFP